MTDRSAMPDALAVTGGPDTGGPDAGGQDVVLRFVGGPLDGRVHVHEARHGEPLPTLTHVHLHGGPKVVHRYDRDGSTGIYRLRTMARRPVRDDTAGE